jgi:hypothetical protein
MPAKRGTAMRHGVGATRLRGDWTADRGPLPEERQASRILHWIHIPVALVLAFGVSGCSLWPWQSVTAANISSDQYVGMTCQELRIESDRLLAEAIDLRPKLAPGQGEEQRKKDIALISREMDAVNRMRATKKC